MDENIYGALIKSVEYKTKTKVPKRSQTYTYLFILASYNEVIHSLKY